MTQNTFPNFRGNDHQPPIGHPEGGPLPPQYNQPPKPPKGHKWDPKSGSWVRKHTGRKIAIVVGAITGGLILLAILVPSPEPVTTDPSTPSATAPAGKPVPSQQPKIACEGTPRNNPCEIQLGQAFHLGSHTVAAGWQLKPGPIGAEITGKATNTEDHTSGMLIEMKFLQGNEVIIDAQCSTDQLEPDQSQAMTCLTTDDFAKYDRITVEAIF